MSWWERQWYKFLGGAVTFGSSISATSVTVTGLTSGRVVTVGTGGLLQDDADMTFATDTLTLTKLTVSSTASGITPITSTGFTTLASLGTLLVTYEDEFISHEGDPVYIQTG